MGYLYLFYLELDLTRHDTMNNFNVRLKADTCQLNVRL